MKKLKYFIFVLFVLLGSGCADQNVNLPKFDVNCKYYFYNEYVEEEGFDYLPIYLALHHHDLIDDGSDPTMQIIYTYNPDIEIVNSIDEAKEILKDSLDVNIDGFKDNNNYKLNFNNNGFSVSFGNSDEVRLSFNFSEDSQGVNFNNENYCPTLYYQGSNEMNYYTYSMSTEVMSYENLYIASESVNKGEIPSTEEQTKYCKFNMIIKDPLTEDNDNYHVYIRKKADMEEYEYAVVPVSDISEEPNFSKVLNYNLITEDFTYLNTVYNNSGYGLINIKYDFSDLKNYLHEDDDGIICPEDINLESESPGSSVVLEGDYSETAVLNGEKFKKVLRDLEPYVKKLADYKGISVLEKLPVQINGNDTNFAWFEINDSLSNVEDVQLEYLTEQKISNVLDYCNSFYDDVDKNKNKQNYDLRMEECISFNDMIKEAVQLGLIRDLSGNCDILSKELIEKLQWFLDIVKIAGPLLAIGLGTLDFIKTVASGDADKEMQNTFKKFRTRIIAAVLLFLVPFVLAFLMDLFLGNQVGYDSDNPFCGVVEWEDYNENR